MPSSIYVAGVAMTPFVRPSAGAVYLDMGAKAAIDALADAGLSYADVEQCYAGYVFGDSTCGQAALYRAGLTGIPIINVNNNCSTGSTALFLARQAVASGVADCVLALGFEQMAPGAIGSTYSDRPSPLDRFVEIANENSDVEDAPMAIKLFGGAGREYQKRFGAEDATFAMVAQKARKHAKHNERAIFRNELTVEEVLASPRLCGPVTRLQCCPPTCGAAAAIVVSGSFARRRGLSMDVAIRAQAMTTDLPSTFEEKSLIKVVGYDLTANAAQQVYDKSGVSPDDVDVVELHDCFTVNEVLSYEALQFAKQGEAERFIRDRDNTYGGSVVTNPSGGLLSKGHPLGATGLAQCAELVWQLRGDAGLRQVEDARIALQHNLGLGGACVVTLYERQ